MVVDSCGISVIDASDPGQSREVDRLLVGIAPEAVYLEGSYAYLFLYSGLFVLDLGTAAPRLASSRYWAPIEVVRKEGSIFKVRTLVYPGNRTVDMSDPEHPAIEQLKDESVRPQYPTIGTYVYHMSCGKLRVEDSQRSTVAEVRLAESDCSGEWDVAVGESHAYVAGGGNLYIFDASDPVSPKLLATQALGRSSGVVQEEQARVRVEGNYAFLLHRGGLWVFDLGDPEMPAEVAYYSTEAVAMDVDADGRRIALVDNDGTVTLLQYDLGEEAP
jgi:hypothetical protein